MSGTFTDSNPLYGIYPAVNIPITQAAAYCNWLTAQDVSHTYRLPTDEEWILAAGHMPKDVSMNSGYVESGLTAVDAYSQTTGACSGIPRGHGASPTGSGIWASV